MNCCSRSKTPSSFFLDPLDNVPLGPVAGERGPPPVFFIDVFNLGIVNFVVNFPGGLVLTLALGLGLLLPVFVFDFDFDPLFPSFECLDLLLELLGFIFSV